MKEIALEGCNTEKYIISAIYDLQNEADIIIIIRGGGSTSNISASFDKIKIFEAIKNSSIPIITAIGHEADKNDKLLITNISDYNFPTPSSAAKKINKIFIKPVYQYIIDILEKLKYHFNNNSENHKNEIYAQMKYYIDTIIHIFRFKTPIVVFK